MSSPITPFTIAVPDTEISRLKSKLSLSSFPDELDDSAWDYGAPLADLKRLANYWEKSYDWRGAEERLNQFPQYTTEIQAEGFDALKVHFVHERSEVKGAVPLLFVHGCERSLHSGKYWG
jgi:hypothetical protein